MKRKRTNSSAESPSLRTTRSNASLNGSPTDDVPKKRTSSRTTKATDGSTPSSRLRQHPQQNSSSTVASTFAVEVLTKKRQLVSPQNKSRIRSDTRPPQSDPPSPMLPIRLVERKNFNGNQLLTPVKKNARHLQQEIADGESERIIARGVQRNQLDNEEDDYSEEDEEDEEESEQEEEENITEREKVATTAAYDNFFQYAAKRKKSATSNNTLSLLPTLTLQESTTLLASIPDHHAMEKENLHNAHRQQFNQWKFEINHGYNILLFGYGSKRSLIEEFGREELADDMAVLVINGYFPSLSLDTILVQILQQIDAPITGGDKLQLIQSHLSEPLAILIHSLDSPILRLSKNQQILSTLAANKYITIIASIDHVNAPLLFDSLKSSRYNFLWHDCTTFTPYRTELSFEETTFLSGGTSATSAVGGLAGIKAVLNNLTSNSRSLYLFLLQYQLPLHPESNDPAGQEQGITFPNLRALVAKKILPLSNTTTLNNVLGEFFDHGLIVRNDGRGNMGGRKGRGGGEVLWAPFGKVVVREVIEFLGGEVET